MFEGEERANSACNLRSKCFAFHGMDESYQRTGQELQRHWKTRVGMIEGAHIRIQTKTWRSKGVTVKYDA
jgi:hypothetical protein